MLTLANIQISRGVVAAGNPIDVEAVVERLTALTAGTPFQLPDAVVTGPKGWGHGIVLTRQPAGGQQVATWTDDVNWFALSAGSPQRVYSTGGSAQAGGIMSCTSVRSRAIPSAAGTFPGCTGTLSRDVPAAPAGARLEITRFLKPANPAVAVAYVGRQSNPASSAPSQTITWTFNSQTGDNMAVDLDTDDTTGDAVITLPALAPGEEQWVERGRHVWAGGTFVTLMKRVVDPTIKSYTFGIAAPATVAPVNTVAPTVSGTPAINQTLTCDGGTFTGGPLTKTYQWIGDDGSGPVDVPGAINSTYVTGPGDAGKTFTCEVTATNAIGPSTPALSSNSIVIPAAPTVISRPVITPAGPYHSGSVVFGSDGSITGSGLIIARQWYRGVSPISGETFANHLIAPSEEGATLFFRVTATNGGGTVTADSDPIVPVSTTPLGNDSGQWFYTGGTDNDDPALSFGGARGATVPDNTVNSVIGPIIGSVAAAGGVFYPTLMVRNTHATTTDPATRLMVVEQPANPGVHIAVAVPVEGVGVNPPLRASLTTEPPGVTWTAEDVFADAPAFGDLPGPSQRAVHLRVTIDPGTEVDADGSLGHFTIRVRSETA